ncbi:MAG: hypothetical protein J6D54_12800 [Olsenella sp.]|nr:hypothetical protein [Olsenella sp.]
MAVGTIQTSILTDIANAIRYQAGVATTFRPSQMAAAVAALDGTDAGGYVERPYMELESGVLSSAVFDDIADAIRAQNGSSDQYAPGEMAAAILGLTWDTGVKARAILTGDGTLEFNYRDGRSSDEGTIAQCWDVDPAGYASDTVRPWHAARAQVKRVVFDSDWSGAGVTNYAYWCTGMLALSEVCGFEQCSGATDVRQMFTSCTSLDSIYATSFDNSAIASYASVLYGCNRLVGGTGYVPTSTAGKAALSLGSSGVLTDPNADARTWVWGHLYVDGELVIKASDTPEASRALTCSGRVCTNAHYQAAGCTPWYDSRASVRLATFAADLATATLASIDYWFYSHTALLTVSGWENVRGLASLRYAMNGCSGLVSLDLSGFDPSSLKDLFYAFAQCKALETIYADSTWTLPSGCSGLGTFYNDTRLKGGNGTEYSSSAYGYARMVIDREGQAGYLTAAD